MLVMVIFVKEIGGYFCVDGDVVSVNGDVVVEVVM